MALGMDPAPSVLCSELPTGICKIRIDLAFLDVVSEAADVHLSLSCYWIWL